MWKKQLACVDSSSLSLFATTAFAIPRPSTQMVKTDIKRTPYAADLQRANSDLSVF
jgi:hypothetical protein